MTALAVVSTADLGARRRWRDVADEEQLGVDLALLDAELDQQLPATDHHLVRAAEEPRVDVGDRDERGQDPLEPVAVEPTAEQLDVGGLAGQHVDQVESAGVAVLEVLELLQEHDRLRRAVAVQQREPALGLVPQRGGEERDHGRDPAAGGDRHVVLAVRRVERGGEPAGRRHHLELVADLQRLGDELGERSAAEPLHRDPQPALAGRRADRVVAPHVVTDQRRPDRHVLAGLEVVRVGEVGRDLERDRDRVVGQRLDLADPQRVELRVPMTGLAVGDGDLGHSDRLEVVERLGARASRPTATCTPSTRTG